MKHLLFVLFTIVLTASSVWAQVDVTKVTQVDLDGFAPLFPFVISYDSPDNATNMSHFLSVPIENDDFVRIENGHFVNKHGRVKLNATNLTGPANFPTHEEADRLADRLARFGINCVRLHYFDAAYQTFKLKAEQGIFKAHDAWKVTETLPEFDPQQRDKQDYLIAAFKKRGIYVDMNLLVARIPKKISHFDPNAIRLEKQYAKELLTHVNPYTGLAYTDDPVVAVIEINNENAFWLGDPNYLTSNLSPHYKEVLQQQWNQWLAKKYKSTAEMRKAWEFNVTPLGEELIPEGTFTAPINIDGKKWILQKGGSETAVESKDGVLRIHVTKEGENWFPKLYRTVSVKQGENYTLTFKVRRVDGPNRDVLGYAVATSENGWQSVGCHGQYNNSDQWVTVTHPFTATKTTDIAQVQMTRFKIGTYEIKDLSFRPGIDWSFANSGSLEQKNVPFPFGLSCTSAEMKKDVVQFLYDTEKAYWYDNMYKYIKEELKAKAPISGTQVGPWSFIPMMAKLDYIDAHHYFNHPSISGRQWTIGNESMVNSISCMRELAEKRVDNYPYTISEYNNPFPNLYGAEGQPFLRAFGAFQGWDGVFAYSYNNSPMAEPTSQNYFFSLVCRTDVLAHLPACSAIYLRGDVHEAKETILANWSEKKYLENLSTTNGNVTFSQCGFSNQLALVHKIAIDLTAQTGVADPKSVTVSTEKIIVSDTGELIWNREIPNRAYWLVDTDNTKLFTGFPEGRTITFKNGSDVTLTVGKTRLNWATVSLTSKTATGFGNKGKTTILLAATGYSGNKDMKIVTKNGIHTTLDDWGTGPVMVEGIPAEIILPASADKTHCYALDPSGNRKIEVPVIQTDDGKSKIQIDPKYQTVWYEIEVE